MGAVMVSFCVSHSSIAMAKSKLRKQQFVLAGSLRGIESIIAGKTGRLESEGCMAVRRQNHQSHCIHTQETQGKNRKWGHAIDPKSPPPVMYLLPEARFHLLKVP